MQDLKIMIVTRSKLVALKTAGGLSLADASAWADEHLEDAVTNVMAAPKGTDPFAGLATWARSIR